MTDDLARVTKRIGVHVLAFLRERKAGERFTASELLAYVTERSPSTAPGSPCRVFRRLCETGAARVRCIPPLSAGVYEVITPPPEAAWRRCQRDGHVYERESDHQCARCGESRGGHGGGVFDDGRW